MKLLVDSQLPPALARHLNGPGVTCLHVRDVGLSSATDKVIWEFAKLEGMVIISKDEDFPLLSNALGTPPQVVWVRLGNCRRGDLINAFDRHWTVMQATLLAGVPVVELR